MLRLKTQTRIWVLTNGICHQLHITECWKAFRLPKKITSFGTFGESNGLPAPCDMDIGLVTLPLRTLIYGIEERIQYLKDLLVVLPLLSSQSKKYGLLEVNGLQTKSLDSTLTTTLSWNYPQNWSKEELDLGVL